MNSATIAALYTFAAHNHSGQGSRGYRILCLAERAWIRRAGIAPRLDYWERLVENHPRSPVAIKYRALAKRYAREV